MKIQKDREKYISLSLISTITINHSLQPEKPLQKFRHTIMIVISGHLIPAGTGLRQWEKIIVGSKEEYDRIQANRKNVTDYSQQNKSED